MAGTLTDCMQEKKRAGRFSPKNTISEVETDGQRDTETEGKRQRTERQRQKVQCRKKSSVTLSLWSVIWGGTRTDQLQPSFRTQGECRLPAHPGWVSALLRHRAPGLLLGAWQGRRNPSVFISTFDSARIRKSKVTAGHMVQ